MDTRILLIWHHGRTNWPNSAYISNTASNDTRISRNRYILVDLISYRYIRASYASKHYLHLTCQWFGLSVYCTVLSCLYLIRKTMTTLHCESVQHCIWCYNHTYELLTSLFFLIRLSEVRSQTIPKDPSAASVYFVKILIDCLCVAPATEKELRNAVIEKCKLSGVKSTTRGTVSGNRLSYCLLCCSYYEVVFLIF